MDSDGCICDEFISVIINGDTNCESSNVVISLSKKMSDISCEKLQNNAKLKNIKSRIVSVKEMIKTLKLEKINPNFQIERYGKKTILRESLLTIANYK